MVPIFLELPANKEWNTLTKGNKRWINDDVTFFYLWYPVDAHDKKQLKKNPEVSHLTFAKLVFLPDPTVELENHQEVEDTIDTQEYQDDYVEIEKPWQVLSNHARDTNTEIKIQNNYAKV